MNLPLLECAVTGIGGGGTTNSFETSVVVTILEVVDLGWKGLAFTASGDSLLPAVFPEAAVVLTVKLSE